jgi:hypothetical protein
VGVTVIALTDVSKAVGGFSSGTPQAEETTSDGFDGVEFNLGNESFFLSFLLTLVLLLVLF